MRGTGSHAPRAIAALHLVVLSCMLAMCAPASLWAQPATAPIEITAPDSLAIAPRSPVAMPVSVRPSEAIPAKAFLRLRGLPPTAALSEGYSIAPGAWAVALNALPNLKVTLPASANARSEITLALVSVEGRVLAERKMMLLSSGEPPETGTSASPNIPRTAPGAAPAPATPKQAASPPPPAPPKQAVSPPPPAPLALTPEQRARALRLLKRGQELVAEANLAEARLLFEKAADIGLAEAAMALGATYDQEELTRLAIRGARPEPALARRWYERAAQLGEREAQQRLQRLGSN